MDVRDEWWVPVVILSTLIALIVCACCVCDCRQKKSGLQDHLLPPDNPC